MAQNIQLNTARLQIKGYWGNLSKEHLSFNAMSDDVWRNAVRQGKTAGLRRYGLENGKIINEYSNPKKSLAKGMIGLAYRPVFPTSQNSKAAWGGNAATFLREVPDAFYGNAGLLHANATPNTDIEYSSNFQVARNQGFSWRISLAKQPTPEADEGNPNPTPPVKRRVRLQWSNWRFEIGESGARIQRFKSAGVGDTTALDALLDKDERTLQDEQSILQMMDELFEIDESVSLPNGSQGEFSDPSTLTFIPEARGVLRIECAESGESVVVAIHSIQKARKAGTLWNASNLRITSNGGVFLWQMGRPSFATWAQLRLGEFVSKPLPANLPVNAHWDESNAGTNVEVTHEKVRDGEGGTGDYEGTNVYEIVITLTGNGSSSPWLYGLQLFVPAGARDGDNAVVWDSDGHLNDAGDPPIEEIDISLEGSNDEGQTSSAAVTLSYFDAALFDELPKDGDLPRIENRLCDLTLNGQMWLRGGIITKADFTNLADDGTVKADTQCLLQISDIWAVLNDDLMSDDPIGDGLTLGDYIDIILRGAGLKTYERGYIASFMGLGGVGKKLPVAAAGEEPCVRPQIGQSRGDFLRELVSKYGMGRELYWRGEVGQMAFRMPSGAVKAAFSTTPDAPLENKIVIPIDVACDWSDCFNAFYIEGKGMDDETISKTIFIYESFEDPNSPLYLGRVKWHPDVKDDALRTSDDLNYVARSLVKRFSRQGRFVNGHLARFRADLWPGDIVTVDGKKREVVRVPEASWKALGSMTLVLRKLE